MTIFNPCLVPLHRCFYRLGTTGYYVSTTTHNQREENCCHNVTKRKYISKGFHSWKKAPKYFNDHQNSNCHKAAASYHAVQSNDIGDLVNKYLADSRMDNRSYLITVITGLRYLARRNIAIQGTHGFDSFTHLLRLLGTKDPLVIEKLERSSLKFSHSDVQNELLDIMAKQVLSKKVAEIRKMIILASCAMKEWTVATWNSCRLIFEA